jgi:hypothetical protein
MIFADSTHYTSRGEELMKRLVSGIMLALLLIRMLMLVFNVQPIKCSPTTTISVDPPTKTVRLNMNFTVSINIEDVTDLDGWSTTLEWDSSLLEIVNVTVGSFCEDWKTAGGSYYEWDQSRGLVYIVAYNPYPFDPTMPINGNGTLAEVKFCSTSLGQCVLDLKVTTLIDGSPIWISAPPYLGDADGDMLVNSADYAVVLSHMGIRPYGATADFNSDGKVDIYDLRCLHFNWLRNYTEDSVTTQPVEISHQVYDGTVKVDEDEVIEVSVRGEKVIIRSNVSISNCAVYDSFLGFEASGPSGSTGRINVTFPKINTTDIEVFINGEKLTPPPFPVISHNETHYFIYFELTLSTREITIQYGIADINITNVTPCKAVVGQGYPVSINVTVENQGDSTESFNVTAYYSNSATTITPEQWDTFWSMGDVNRDGYINQTDADIIMDNYGWTGPPGENPADINSDGTVNFYDMIICANNQGLDIWNYFSIYTVLGVQEIVNLFPGNSATTTFVWDTTGVAKGNHTIKAVADFLIGETDTGDNTYLDGWVKVTIPGDVSEDELIWVDMQDISMMIDWFMAKPPTWNPNCDVNNDLTIDMADISIAIDHFMQT